MIRPAELEAIKRGEIDLAFRRWDRARVKAGTALRTSVGLVEVVTVEQVPAPPEVDWTDPSVSEAMRRFYLDSKRVSNARAKAELGWRPRYPTYREGLAALIR